MKKIFILISGFQILIAFFMVTIGERKYLYASSDNEIVDIIFNTMDDVDNYVKSQYKQKDNFKMSTTHNLGVLSTRNVSASNLLYKYNNQLDMTPINNKFDLNGDNIINYMDNLGETDGICAPTAAAIAMRYLVYNKKVSYNCRIKNALYGEFTDNPNDIFNVFYEIVDVFISCGWKGSEATAETTTNAVNIFLNKNNSNFFMKYTQDDLLNAIDSNYQQSLPCLGFILPKNATIGHVAAIAGYYTKEVTYTEKILFITSNKKVNLHFIVINTGWKTTTMGDSGGASQEEYDGNYSYVLLDHLYGVTYFV